jgi:hypothetical protein
MQSGWTLGQSTHKILGHNSFFATKKDSLNNPALFTGKTEAKDYGLGYEESTVKDY